MLFEKETILLGFMQTELTTNLLIFTVTFQKIKIQLIFKQFEFR